MKILFICSSNICRSPYSEYVFKEIVKDYPILCDKITSIRSAAVFNKSRKLHPMAYQSLVKEGFNSDYVLSHKPAFKWGDKELFKEADIIIGMTKSHKLYLPLKYHKKFKTLSEAAVGKYIKIPDPFLKKSQSDYDKVMEIIKYYLYLFADNLCDNIK